MLEQMKEPALSRTVKQMSPAEPAENPREVDGMTAQEIIEAAELADIVDETDGRPLAEKLREAENSGGMLLVDAMSGIPAVIIFEGSQTELLANVVAQIYAHLLQHPFHDPVGLAVCVELRYMTDALMLGEWFE